jgi:hypothetical protein
MIGNHILEPEAAEPSVRKVEFDLLAQPPLQAEGIAVADQEHPNHQFQID